MRIVHRTVIFDASRQPDASRIACFTGLCSLRSGTLLCGFQAGPGKHAPTATIRLCRSRDGGLSWGELPARFRSDRDGVPGSLAAAELVEAAPGRLLLYSTWFDRSEPERPLFDPATEGILRSRQWMCVSTDEGETWGDWIELPVGALTGCATTGPVLSWSDGRTAYAFESFKEFDDPLPAKHAAWLLISRDGGRTHDAPWLVAQDPRQRVYYWDQRLCPVAAARTGEFIGLFWTHDRAAQRDLRVHYLRASIDARPEEVAQPFETTIPGQIAAPLSLADGRVLAFVVDRGGPCTMKLWQSADDGRSWPESDCLTIYSHDEQARLSQGRDDIDFAQYWQDMGKWSFGHPAIRALSNNRRLCAWYAGTPERMSVHGAIVED